MPCWHSAKAGEKARYQRVGNFNILTLSSTAQHPEATQDDNGLHIGKRTYFLNEKTQLLPR